MGIKHKLVMTTNTKKGSIVSFNNDEDFNSYLNDVGNRVQQEWKQTLDFMNKINLDLSLSFTPILDTKYKSYQTNREVRLVMFDDENLVEMFNKKYNKSAEIILQLWDTKGKKSLILLLNIREDVDVNWRGDRLPLTKQEKVLTSWLLDTSEGISSYPYYVVDDVVKSVADKNLFTNVFSVLN